MDYLTAAAIFWAVILLPFTCIGLYAVYCEARDNRRSKAAHAAWLAARKAKQARNPADACLIAAAPELLTALQFCLRDMEATRQQYSMHATNVGVLAQSIAAARAAIAKAEGNQ